MFFLKKQVFLSLIYATEGVIWVDFEEGGGKGDSICISRFGFRVSASMNFVLDVWKLADVCPSWPSATLPHQFTSASSASILAAPANSCTMTPLAP